jgi:(p)ppGpp synthase/HD superfamily hydrolase
VDLMKELQKYASYYSSGTLREKREQHMMESCNSMRLDEKNDEGLVREYVRSVILSHIREVCGEASDDINDALATAQMAHLGQTRRSGEPYLTHPIEVANIVHQFYPEDPTLCAAAILHDTLEDALRYGNVETNEDMESFIAGSFGDVNLGNDTLRLVKALTHSSDDYMGYIKSISQDSDVLKIKLSDMLHNLRSSPSDTQRLKYKNALDSLSSSGHPPPGISGDHWKELMSLIKTDEN